MLTGHCLFCRCRCEQRRLQQLSVYHGESEYGSEDPSLVPTSRMAQAKAIVAKLGNIHHRPVGIWQLYDRDTAS
jgi:hypothetical protein